MPGDLAVTTARPPLGPVPIAALPAFLVLGASQRDGLVCGGIQAEGAALPSVLGWETLARRLVEVGRVGLLDKGQELGRER